RPRNDQRVVPPGAAGWGAMPVAFGKGGAVSMGGASGLSGPAWVGNWVGPICPAAVAASPADAAADSRRLAAFMAFLTRPRYGEGTVPPRRQYPVRMNGSVGRPPGSGEFAGSTDVTLNISTDEDSGLE